MYVSFLHFTSTVAIAALSGAAVAVALRLAWNPPPRTYFDYVPIGALFGAFVLQRFVTQRARSATALACDLAAVVLPLMRVFIPPLPFVSGHTLFASYAMLTAAGRTLRAVALLVLVLAVFDKIFWTGGWISMIAGLAAGCALAYIRDIGYRIPDTGLRIPDTRREPY